MLIMAETHSLCVILAYKYRKKGQIVAWNDMRKTHTVYQAGISYSAVFNEKPVIF